MAHDDAGPKRSPLRVRNAARILDAAQHVFAAEGYHGATIDRIAARAEMSQPNLHNYFKTKADLYAAVLERTLDVWIGLVDHLDANGDPAVELRRFILQKMDLSRQYPEASRVFATEVLRGAAVLRPYIKTRVRQNVAHFREVVEGWIAAGRLRPVDAEHLIYLIWGATQHYADFLPQIKAIRDVPRLSKDDFDRAAQSIADIVLNGLLPV
jgi:TetR/AcrR family transcriptional regulator